MAMRSAQPPGRSPGRPPRISRAQVLAAALALADEHGLGTLTMAAIAERLGVTPMALYRYVPGKAGLLDGMIELLLAEFPPPRAGLPWPERLAALAANIRASARRHPSVFPLLLQRPAATAQARQTLEGIYAALRQAGLSEDQIPQAERLASTAILGFAVSEVAGRFRDHTRRQLDADFDVLQGMLGDFIRSQAQRHRRGT
jgi:AcrR family transcriptional regulator